VLFGLAEFLITGDTHAGSSQCKLDIVRLFPSTKNTDQIAMSEEKQQGSCALSPGTSTLSFSLSHHGVSGASPHQYLKYSPSIDALRSYFGASNWTFMDAHDQITSPIRLPLSSFNHIAREVLSLAKSRTFYVEILGFLETVRPPFDCEGYWLYGYGLSLHLVATTCPEERKEIKRNRIKHFTKSLPRVDHIAFVTSDLQIIKYNLEKHQVFYKEDSPAGTGIHQIFFFDPDGNVIEVSNCAPPVGELRCVQDSSNKDDSSPCIDAGTTPTTIFSSVFPSSFNSSSLLSSTDPFNAHDHGHSHQLLEEDEDGDD